MTKKHSQLPGKRDIVQVSQDMLKGKLHEALWSEEDSFIGIFGEDHEDLDFVVIACNAHNDLIDAVRVFLTGADRTQPEQFPGHHEAFIQIVCVPRAKAALKKAGVKS